MAVVEVSIIPLGTASPSVSPFVAQAVKVLSKAPNVKYELTPMGTVIEGDLEQVLNIVRDMHEAVFTAGARWVVTSIKIEARRDNPLSGRGKLASLNRELKRHEGETADG